MTVAVFPGTFDPFTRGHQCIAERALTLCDKLVIAIGNNMDKQTMFSPAERQQRIERIFAGENRIETAIYSDLTIDFCKRVGAAFIVRGLRSFADCEQEFCMAQANRAMDNSIDTVFLLANPSDSAVSSTIVRNIIASGGDAGALLPDIF